MAYLMWVQDSKGGIRWKNTYENYGEMTDDLAILEKPSIFGNEDFRIVIERTKNAWNFDKWYVNMETGELTENHGEAMDWYREGDSVQVFKDGRCVLELTY